ncbi:endonuclease/exonuclease/phosphatase family metal-dependent hydrolase [Xanthomonas sacchari]|uniref:endonuclease/exonuclease/phosphatase family protein n=1 Tax=Xanthomonas sacchari TaxID=56458 RepID=UPI002781E522|nr:endonuclease/exonuclease/phosphatase family protein [Xanthomonas sacchari]MDQ1091029.1 endonuclease/exonuclease/phosphatase family metal-dependent hydrolase [Xanthomonas sacchari]
MPAIELLTLNAHMGFSVLKRRFMLPELRAAIRALPADLVFLQEVLGEHQVHAGRHADWPAQSQYAFLADARWPQFAYGRNAVYPHGHHGNALLSRFPIASCVNRDVSIAGHEHRGLLHAVLEIPGHAVAVHAICVHLGLREAHRRRQIGLLGALIADLPAQAPLIVAGDFNDWRQRGHPLLQRHGLTEAFAQLHGRVARSFPARWPLLPLDRIYLRNVRIESARVLTGRPWSQLSDHAPLQARIAV